MPEGSVFIAASLDGFIARPDGGLDWLPHGADGPGEDYGYGAFVDGMDALLMGRATYDKVRTFEEWPYGTKPVFVWSRSELNAGAPATVERVTGDPAAVFDALDTRGFRRVYVDGGKTIQAFLRAGRIGRLILTRIPVLLGTGIPLFGPLPQDVRLHHLATRTYPSGLVQSEYTVVNGLDPEEAA